MQELLAKKIKAVLDYWYGPGVGEAVLREPWEVEFSPQGRLRRLYVRGELAFTFRPRDFYPVPHVLGARLLHQALPFCRRRVVVNEEQEKFVLAGKSVLCKFVLEVDPELRPGDYVLVVSRDDRLLALGQLILPPEVIKQAQRGFAAEICRVLGGSGP
ncbi:MAG: hypothetical protein GXO42_02850 [bacterium]|nr:hypothetical protein [bacterium]